MIVDRMSNRWNSPTQQTNDNGRMRSGKITPVFSSIATFSLTGHICVVCLVSEQTSAVRLISKRESALSELRKRKACFRKFSSCWREISLPEKCKPLPSKLFIVGIRKWRRVAHWRCEGSRRWLEERTFSRKLIMSTVTNQLQPCSTPNK